MSKPHPKPQPVEHGQLKAYPRRRPLERDPRRWYWQVVYHEHSNQHTVAGGSGRFTPNEVKAHLKALNQQGGWTKKPPKKPEPKTKAGTIGRLLSLYIQHQQTRADRGRLKQISVDNAISWRKHLEVIENLPITGVTHAHLQDLVDGWEDAGKSPQSIRNYLRPLRAAWRWGQDRRFVPSTALPRPELPRPARVYSDATPTQVEARAVFEALRIEWHRVYYLVLWRTGGRPGEADNLADPAHRRIGPGVDGDNVIPLNDSVAHQIYLKGKKNPRWVPAKGDLLRALRAREAAGGALWPVAHPQRGMATVLPRACRRAGVDTFPLYGLRRLAVSTLIPKVFSGEISPQKYVSQLGHSLDEGLRTYARVVGATSGDAADLLAGGVVLTDQDVITDELREREG
ncbi:MAG: hypothetical protein AAFV53_11380 [Myxococcota bacterium]